MSMGESAEAAGGEVRMFRVMRMLALAILIIGGGVYLYLPGCTGDWWVTCHFYNTHDVFMVMLLAAALFVLTLRTRGKPENWTMHRPGSLGVAVLCVAVFVCGALGRDLVFEGFDLSRDEVMAVFDAEVFRSGRLFSSLPAQWRDFQLAIQPLFMAPIHGGEHVISAYLPVNAALRALFSLLADPRFLNPLLAAGAVAVVYDLARQLWPQRPDAALVAALLLATSSQLLVTSMTSYAMTGHLIFNLLWLRCFLRGGKAGHAGALILGFFACGLHQVVFHPLFAAPFILRLLRSRRRALGLFYALGYLVMILFWGSYLRLAVLWDGHALPVGVQSASVGMPYFLERVLLLLLEFDARGALLIIINVLRFVTWQNFLLLPLCLLSRRAIRAREGVTRELAAGIGLTLLAMFVLLPIQGLGWGYRYWHGLLGNFCLLGACGWICITRASTPLGAGGSARVLAAASAFSIMISLPLNARHAQAVTAPVQAARRAIAAAPVDIVLVDETGMRLGIDLVRNDPALKGRPLTLSLMELERDQLESLCGRYRIALFGREHIARVGLMAVPGEESRRSTRLRQTLASLDCAQLLQ